jgi:hypothetical protein
MHSVSKRLAQGTQYMLPLLSPVDHNNIFVVMHRGGKKIGVGLETQQHNETISL